MNPTIHKWTTNPQIPFGGTREDEKGSIMEIVLNGMVYTTLIDETTGKWSWIPELPLADGPYTVSTRVIDKAGNANAPTQVILHVDTTAPNKPDILRVVDDEGLQQGWLTPGAKTDDKTPTLSGNAEPGSIVRLYDGSNEIGSALTDQSGHWEITPTAELSDGTHHFTVTSTDPMGHTSDASDVFSLTIEEDSLPPIGEGATITHASDNVGTATGTLLDGAITDDTTPTLSGTAPAGSTVRIQYRADNGKWIEGGNATLNGNGWTWAPSPTLVEGKYEFRANAGNGWSDEFQLSIETNAESSVEISYAIDDVAPWTGRLDANAITDDKSPELHGVAEANSKVFLFYRNTAKGEWISLGEALVNADSRWSLETSGLSVGSFQFKATTVNDSSSEGAKFDLTIIDTASFKPSIDHVWDNNGMITGEVKAGGKTDDTRPEFSGKAESNSIIVIEYTQKNGSWQVLGSAITDATGHWVFTPSDELDYAEWSFRVKNSNNNSYSDEFSFIIDSTDLKETIYDFERFDKGALPSAWNYDNLTFKLVSENIDLEIIETQKTGKLLVINSPQVSLDKHTEVTIELKENVNYFELQTYNWKNADSYVAFFDNKGNELGRRYFERFTNNGDFSKLNFHTENNDISYVKIMTKGKSTQFGIDNIITKKNYIIDTSEISSGVEYFQGALNDDYLPLHVSLKYNSGLTITHTSGVDSSYYKMNDDTQDWALLLRNKSSYRIDFESPTSALSFKIGKTIVSGHEVNYYSEDGTLLHTEVFAIHTSFQTYGYVAKPGEKISYATITTIDNKSLTQTSGGFFIDTIKWGVDAQYDPNIKDSLVNGEESFNNLKDMTIDGKYLRDLAGPITFSSGLTLTHLAGKDSATVSGVNGDRLTLRNDSSYKFDFGSDGKTTDINFDLIKVDVDNAHEIVIYSTYGEQLYRTLISDSQESKTYHYTAAEGKFISHFIIMTKDDTLPEKPNGGIGIDNIKWGSEIISPSTEVDDKPYKFINEYEVSVNEHGTTLDLSTLLASSAKTNSVTLNDFDQNTLLIEAPNLLDNTLVGFFIDDNHHQLMVKGDKDDVVKLSDISPEGDTAEWSQQHGSLTIAGVEYQVFTALNHDTEVLVQQGIKVELI